MVQAAWFTGRFRLEVPGGFGPELPGVLLLWDGLEFGHRKPETAPVPVSAQVVRKSNKSNKSENSQATIEWVATGWRVVGGLDFLGLKARKTLRSCMVHLEGSFQAHFYLIIWIILVPKQIKHSSVQSDVVELLKSWTPASSTGTSPSKWEVGPICRLRGPKAPEDVSLAPHWKLDRNHQEPLDSGGAPPKGHTPHVEIHVPPGRAMHQRHLVVAARPIGQESVIPNGTTDKSRARCECPDHSVAGFVDWFLHNPMVLLFCIRAFPAANHNLSARLRAKKENIFPPQKLTSWEEHALIRIRDGAESVKWLPNHRHAPKKTLSAESATRKTMPNIVESSSGLSRRSLDRKSRWWVPDQGLLR